MGTKGTEAICHYGNCQSMNVDLNLLVVDHNGIRYFCEAHWKWVISLFTKIKGCTQCRRNHRADVYKESRTVDTVKYQGGWWELCECHSYVIDKQLCIFIDL